MVSVSIMYKKRDVLGSVIPDYEYRKMKVKTGFKKPKLWHLCSLKGTIYVIFVLGRTNIINGEKGADSVRRRKYQ